MNVRVSTDWSYRGLSAVVLENRLLRIAVLPEAGGKIWQITYKPLDADLLWNNPRIGPAKLPMGSRYDDVWSGGWDELFPNDEVAVIEGESYPDHGELWTGHWTADPFSQADLAGVRLRYVTPISFIEVEKTILSLRSGQARIEFQHRFTNRGQTDFPFLWKLHPAMADHAEPAGFSTHESPPGAGFSRHPRRSPAEHHRFGGWKTAAVAMSTCAA